MRGLKGKTAIVTGGAAGIGAAIVERFRAEGTQVVIFDLNGEQKVDITDYEAVKQAVADAGPVDILVNNAGWDTFKPFLKTDPGFWQKIIALNLVGVLNMMHCVLPGMVARGGGKVVSVASDAGRVGSSGEAVYSACKGGIIAFSKTLAREVARKGVTVNVVCPGPTDTPILRGFLGEGDAGQKVYDALVRAIPMKRVGQPDDIPGIVAFLASDDAGFITGQVISVSGGLTMAG